ncbi:MAG TPA: DUF885 family protein [Gemmatimonadales bacterium]
MSNTDELCRSFLDLWWHFDPGAATLAGAAGQDGRLGAFDPESVREHVAALRSIAGAVEDLEIDGVGEEIDRTALLDHLRVLLFRLEHEHPYRKNPALWIGHACMALDGLLARPDSRESAAGALERLRALPRFLTSARDTLRDPPQLLVDTALGELAGLSALIDETATRFAPLWVALGEEDGAAAVANAEAEVRRTGQALRSEITPDPEPGAEAIGEDEVDRRLHHEHASVHNGAEVWRAANRLVTEIEAEAAALAAAIDPGRHWRDVYEAAREAHPAGGDLPSQWSQGILQARHAAPDAGLPEADLPPLELVDAPDYVRVTEPVADYVPAGAAGSSARLVLVGGEEILAPWLGARYGVPGLHLHRARAARLASLVRSSITATSTTDGWGLYVQELLREDGLGGSPASLLAERVLALRDAHLAVVDLGIHTKQFTAGEAIGYLAARLPFDRRMAEADVRRLACRPTSAAAAFLGRRELLRLRDDMRTERGSSFVAARFHDEVLAYGGIPVPLIRWGMGLDD